MDNIYQPVSSYQVVQNDAFLDMLNDSNHHLYQQQDLYCNQTNEEGYEVHNFLSQNDHKGSYQEKQWMFGANQFEMKFEESPPEVNNPFFEQHVPMITISRDIRSDSFFGNQLMDLAPPLDSNQNKTSLSHKKEQEIILNNQELFKANQSKSIYLSKISTLIERTVSPSHQMVSPSSPNSHSKIQEKILRKTSNGKQDSESSSDDRNPLQQKLAKNRESARNSRKRKKVYVELLENKVQELVGQINKLEAQCGNQKLYIEQCQNAHHKVQHLFSQEIQIMDEIEKAIKYKQPVEPIINMVEYNIGAASEARSGACDYFINGLLDCIQTNSAKFFCESAEKFTGLFSPSALVNQDLHQLQESIAKEYNELKLGIQQFYKMYLDIRNQAAKIDMGERQIIQIMTPLAYAQQLLCINASVIHQQEQHDQSIKLEDHIGTQSMRKYIKTF